jgi:undecaprenyl diphosphate synthase
LYILLYYGGRQEIVAGAKLIAERVETGELRAQDVDENCFMHTLWMQDAPSVDLVIRTGGRHRLSNFLLFYTAYSELYFLDCLWPDLTEDHLKQAVHHYQKQQRTFGA